MSSTKIIKKNKIEFNHALENFERKNHSIMINTSPPEYTINTKQGFMKESKTGKVGLELFTTFKRTHSKKSIISNNQIFTPKNKDENKEYLDIRHFETQEKIFKMRQDLYSNKIKPILSFNTLKICEKLSNCDKIDYNILCKNTKNLTRNNTKDIFNNYLKLTKANSSSKKYDKTVIPNNSSVNLDRYNSRNPLTRNLHISKENISEIISKNYSLTSNNSFGGISFRTNNKRMNELNNFKDHLTKVEEITENITESRMKTKKYESFNKHENNLNNNSVSINYDMLSKSNENLKKNLNSN